MTGEELQTEESMNEDQTMEDEEIYDEEEYGEGEDELFDDEDADEEAEAVAKRLGDALWADISKAYAQQAGQPEQHSGVPAQPPSPRPPSPVLSDEGDDDEALANAIQTVLNLAAGHASLNGVLSQIVVPGTQDMSLLRILIDAAETKSVAPELADTLSNLVQSIAEGEIFAPSGRMPEADDNEDGGHGTASPSWPMD